MTARARLRFVQTVPTAAASYGSGNYGDNTYGTRATDSAEFSDYIVVPLAAGTDDPVWLRREWDTNPVWECRLVSFGYTEATVTGVPMDVTTLAEAWVRLDRVSAGPSTGVSLPMTIVPPDVLRRQFDPLDLVDLEPGLYRGMIECLFQSGRHLTVPGDDRSFLAVADSPIIEGA